MTILFKTPPPRRGSRPHSYKKSTPPGPDDAAPVYSLEQLDRMDRKFCDAMLAAIAAGTEKCPVGVDAQPSTKRPRTLRAAPTGLRSSFNDNPASDGGLCR
jgi:hypothetical protein